MVALAASLVASAVMVGILFLVARRRVPGTPLTWAEAIAAAVFVTALMVLVYGIVPNQWLLWADNELAWRKDQFFFGESGLQLFGRGRILVPKEALRDIIATVIYAVAVGAHFKIWLWWQRRGKARPVSSEIKESAFGRPLLVREKKVAAVAPAAPVELEPEPAA